MHLNIFCLFLTLVHAAPAIPSETIDPEIGIPGAFQVPVEWDVKPFPDGPTITLEGTIQEVHEQLLEINPKYDSDFDLPGLAARNTLKARTDFSNSKVYCDANVFGKCTVNRLRQGIDYLRGVGDQPRNGGGPGACGRVSCSYGTAIWWCNDSRSPKTLNSFGSIADGAQRVWGICAGRMDYGLQPGEVSGQAFHSSDWNVIVRKNNC